jgi:hypothetical protein
MSTFNPDNNIDPVEEGEFVSTLAPAHIQSQVKTSEPTPTKPVPSFNNIDLYKLADLPKPAEASLTVQKDGSEEEEDNDGDDDKIGVEESKTKLPIYKTSGFKIAIIGGALLAIIVTLNQLVFPGDETPKVVVSPPPSPEKKKVDFEPDPRMGVLTSKVAIQDQKNAITAAQQQQAAAAQQQQAANNKGVPAAGTQPVKIPQLTPAASVPTSIAPAPTSTDPPAPPQIITNNRQETTPVYRPPNSKIIYRRYKTPRLQPIKGLRDEIAQNQPVNQPQARIITRSQPVNQPQARIITRSQPVSQPQARIITRSQPVSQPQARIITRSQPVSQPQGKIITRSQPVNQPQPPTPANWETANNNAVGTWGRTNRMSIALEQKGTPMQINSNVVQLEPMSDNPVALVGQQLRAKTIVPYQVGSNNKGSQAIVIALSDPLADTRGNLMLPMGTQVMAEMTILDNGLMQIASAKIYRNGQMVELPKQSLILQNNNKQPLIAQSQDFGSGDLANRDLMTIGTGALQGVGKNLIQSQTQTIIANGATIQNSNGQVNYLGAALEGGLSPVLSQWAARNQAAANQVNTTSKLWLLPTGTDVNLVIAQPFSL